MCSSAFRHRADFHCQCYSALMWLLLPAPAWCSVWLTSDVDTGHVNYLKSFHPRLPCHQSLGWKLDVSEPVGGTCWSRRWFRCVWTFKHHLLPQQEHCHLTQLGNFLRPGRTLDSAHHVTVPLHLSPHAHRQESSQLGIQLWVHSLCCCALVVLNKQLHLAGEWEDGLWNS